MKIKNLIKIICSAVISFAILNAVCFFYYNIPVHSESKTNSTDYVWESNKFRSSGTEGFAWVKTDANGFNNLDAEYGKSPEILIMGSSHTEAFNVSQKENYVCIINSLFAQNGLKAYNIGISGHTLTTCINNFENAVKEFTPSKYVIMEVSSTELSMNDIENISDGTVKKIHSTANSILIFLQKIPFIRCVYHQIDKMGFEVKKTSCNAPDEKSVLKEMEATDSNDDYESALNELLMNLNSVAQKNGVKLIIFLNPNLNIGDDGKVIPRNISSKEEIFAIACQNNNIEYIDMYGAYTETYNKTYRLPHGFSNTAVGKGHLNKYGHETVANVLYEHISELEKHSMIEA